MKSSSRSQIWILFPSNSDECYWISNLNRCSSSPRSWCVSYEGLHPISEAPLTFATTAIRQEHLSVKCVFLRRLNRVVNRGPPVVTIRLFYNLWVCFQGCRNATNFGVDICGIINKCIEWIWMNQPVKKVTSVHATFWWSFEVGVDTPWVVVFNLSLSRKVKCLKAPVLSITSSLPPPLHPLHPDAALFSLYPLHRHLRVLHLPPHPHKTLYLIRWEALKRKCCFCIF